MNARLHEIVEREVASYRYGAPITVYDIIVGATADGIDISEYSGKQISCALARICDSRPGPYGDKDRRSFYRRATA